VKLTSEIRHEIYTILFTAKAPITARELTEDYNTDRKSNAQISRAQMASMLRTLKYEGRVAAGRRHSTTTYELTHKGRERVVTYTKEQIRKKHKEIDRCKALIGMED